MHLTKDSIITLLILLAVLFLAGGYVAYIMLIPRVGEEAQLRNVLTPNEGEAAFTDLSGQDIALSEDFGKITVVYSWASWCPQCVSDLPLLNELANSYTGQDDVVFVAINRAEDKYTAERFLATLPDLGSLKIVLDPTDHLFKSMEGYAMPEYVIFTKTGEEAYRGRGSLQKDSVEATVEELRD